MHDIINPTNEKIITIRVLFGLVLLIGITASLIVEKTGVSLLTCSFTCSTCLDNSVTTALMIWNSASSLSLSLITKELTEFKFDSEK